MTGMADCEWSEERALKHTSLTNRHLAEPTGTK